MKKISSLLFGILISSQSAFALPGFVDAVRRYHPELSPKCTTCHQPAAGASPSNTNVRPEGLRLYRELLQEENARTAALRSLSGQVSAVDFVVFGDTRTHADVHQRVVSQICALSPRAVFQTGDIVADGSDTKLWQEALKIEACLIQPKLLHAACGNHEGSSCLNNPLRQALGNTDKFYTVDLGPFTFIALDSNAPTADQLDWLGKLPPGKRYIPFYHHAPYPTIAGHGPDKTLLKKYVPLFKALGVKLALNGHNHGYDRAEVDGISYVTTGGGGAPLYPCGSNKRYTKACFSENHFLKCSIADSTIACDAITLTGKVLDTFSVVYP